MRIPPARRPPLFPRCGARRALLAACVLAPCREAPALRCRPANLTRGGPRLWGRGGGICGGIATAQDEGAQVPWAAAQR